MSEQILKAYKYRLYPNAEQLVFFAKSFGCTRFIWNKMLSDKIEHYEKTKSRSIKLPKIGHIKAKIDREINGLIKSATVSKTPAGKYFVSVLVDTIAQPSPKTNSSVGIDLGITDLADWHGKQIVKISRWFPSSKTCSACHHVLGRG